MTEWPDSFEQVLRANLPLLTDDAELPPDAALRDLGLSSMTVMRLLVQLENEFDVAIPDEALITGAYETAHALWKLVSDAGGTEGW